jgi:Phage tail tube protein
MGNRFGVDAFIGWAKETSWGVAVTPRTLFLDMIQESGGLNPGLVEYPMWRDRQSPGFYMVGSKVLKNLGIPLCYDGMLHFLRHLLNGYAYVQVAPGPPARNTHTFTVDGTTMWNSGTLEIGNSEATDGIYSGAYVRKGQLEFKASEMATAALDIVAKDRAFLTKSAAPTIVDATALGIIPSQITLKVDTVLTEVDQVTVTIESGLDEGVPKIKGSSSIGQPMLRNPRMDISASFSRDYNDSGLQTKFAAGTSAKLEILCVGPALSGGFYGFTITIPKLVLSGEEPVHSGSGLVTESLTGKAIKDATDTMCKIVVTNSEIQMA